MPGVKRARRRVRGEGTIGKQGGRWFAEVSLGVDPTTGKRNRKRVYGATEEEARKARNALLFRYDSGALPGGSMTVEDLAEAWLEDRKKEIKKSSYARYRDRIRNFIVPVLGTVRSDRLDRALVDRLRATMVDQGLAETTVGLVLATLRSIVIAGTRAGYIGKNPFAGMKLGRVRTKVTSADSNEVRKIVAAAEKPEFEDFRLFVLIALFCGLRRNELASLQWSDVNLEEGVLTVEHNNFEGEPTTTKSGRSRRVKLAPSLVEILSEAKSRQRAGTVLGLGTVALVCPAPTGGIMRTATIFRRWKALLLVAGVEHRNLHSCRHTFATHFLKNGGDLGVLSSYLGHSSRQITADIYAHVLDEMEEEERGTMERMMGRLRGAKKGGSSNATSDSA